ncbi:glycosyltransferase [Telmatocola sphagniphila]|uniref:Glycosyltransferase n=2 Tax=Telmatocola sphagniphila TaxID=1123043 RepID=A0A8E6BBV6_9BACT|nr:glycosyltransferase [Telmatocola sphagniphila]
MVVIGRNEGERLRLCLESLRPDLYPIIYVDSGSTDSSVSLARSLNVEVVDLDMTVSFTAARARNAGFQKLLEKHPDLTYVQFVDGDCEVLPGWLERALEKIQEDPKNAVVCGRRRERFPEKTVYNRLCDIEWNTPVGQARSCGGDALMRVAALKEVGGYNPSVIAAEDDEVCVRIRQAGWKIWRIDADMTLHDAAMTRFGQWWKRATRCGYAYAQGAFLHGAPPEKHFTRERRRLIVWGFVLPALILALLWPTGGWSLLGLLLYPLQALRISRRPGQAKIPLKQSLVYGVSCVGAKVPEFLGLARFYSHRLFRKQGRIIEYK